MSTNVTSNPFANCTGITPECPVAFSPLTYQPSLAANAIFFIIFVVCALAQLVLGIRYRTWSYMVAVFIGTVLELLGYLGRLRLHTNPFDSGAFQIQIITLIIAPAFLSAGIYLTLKHFVLTFGRQWSLLRPALYTWIFVSMDILSLLVQAAGAALFGSNTTDINVLKLGGNIALAGIIIQVVSLACFGLFGLIYLVRLMKNRSSLTPAAAEVARASRTQLYIAAVGIAYVTVLVRCVYRIPELAGGYRNAVYLDQTGFIVCEGVMISIAAIALSVFHPGIFFPQFKAKNRTQELSQAPVDQYIELGHQGKNAQNHY